MIICSLLIILLDIYSIENNYIFNILNVLPPSTSLIFKNIILFWIWWRNMFQTSWNRHDKGFHRWMHVRYFLCNQNIFQIIASGWGRGMYNYRLQLLFYLKQTMLVCFTLVVCTNSSQVTGSSSGKIHSVDPLISCSTASILNSTKSFTLSINSSRLTAEQKERKGHRTVLEKKKMASREGRGERWWGSKFIEWK